MEYKPISARDYPRYSAIKTFLRLPHVGLESDFDVGICGVPYDGGVTYRPGCRFGPTRIREVSALGREFHWGRSVDFTEKLKVADLGDCPTVPLDQEKNYKKIESYFSYLVAKKKRFVAVGGDHSISLPILRALRKQLGQPVNLIHFDAHLDSYPAAWECEFHHGSFVRHAVNEGLVVPGKSVQIGLRGPLSGREDLDFAKQNKIHLLTMDRIRSNSIEDLVNQFPDWGNAPTYITFDIDCLDPAYAPGTGTPVVGGLTTYETQQILRLLTVQNLVGADIVEVSPPFDHSEITSLAAVDTLFEILCLMGSKIEV